MRRIALATTTLALIVTAAHAQEPVLLRISGTPGQANHYQTVTETYIMGGPMAAMMGGDTTQPMSRMKMFSTRTLTGTTGDTLNFQEVVDSASIESPAMPQMSAMMSAQVAALRGQTTNTKMDARGRIFSAEVAGASGGPMGGGPGGSGGPGGAGAGGGRGRGMMGGGRGRNATPFILPAQPVRPGDTWTDSTTMGGSSPDEPTTTMRGNFKLDRMEQRAGNSVAVVTLTGTMTIVGPQGTQNMNVVGEIDIDQTARRLASMNMRMNGTVQSQQGEIPMKVHMTQSVM
jgi:hypothetical protein